MGTRGAAPATLPVLVLEGAPRQRGRIHGETLRERIQGLVGAWQGLVGATLGADPDAFVTDFLARTRFRQAIDRWTPGLLDEVRGIAEGAAVPFPTLLAFNCADENQWFLRYRSLGLPLPEARGCSSLGAWNRSGPPLVAQNLDIPSGTDGFGALLHLRHEGSPLESYLFTVAGMIGLVGLSNAPVALCNNALPQLNQRPDGLPVNFVVRGVLAQPDYRRALHYLESVKHASGQTYVVGGSREVAMLECSANQVARLVPSGPPDCLIHTNHPVASRDVNGTEALAGNVSDSDTEVRWRVLERRVLDAAAGSVSVETIQEVLRSHDDPANPVCRHRDENPAVNFSAASLVCELSVPPVLHLAPGPPCRTEFRRYGFQAPEARGR